MSKLLDPVSGGWTYCIQAIAAMTLLVEEQEINLEEPSPGLGHAYLISGLGTG